MSAEAFSKRKGLRMKLGLGLYRHMLSPDYYDFARASGLHARRHSSGRLFSEGLRESEEQSADWETSMLHGELAGDPGTLWTVEEMRSIRLEIEAAGLSLAANRKPRSRHLARHSPGWSEATGTDRIRQDDSAANGRGWHSRSWLQLQHCRRLRAGLRPIWTRSRNYRRNGRPRRRRADTKRNRLEYGV